MTNWRMRSTLVLGILLSVAGCMQSAAQTYSCNSPNAGTPAQTLDIVFNGPFAFFQQPGSMLVLLPDVEDHNPPTAISSGDMAHIVHLRRGAYDFTHGILSSTTALQAPPVLNTYVYPVSTKVDPSSLGEKPYFTMKLPIPSQIVPWNADPLGFSLTSSSVLPDIKGPRYATLTILRYKMDSSSDIQLLGLKGLDKFVWCPMAAPIGTERIVTISVEPANPDNTEHQHAKNAFNHLKNMLGLTLFISFPNVAVPLPPRNTPLIYPFVLPKELTDALPGSNVPTLMEFTSARSPKSLELFGGPLNDCRVSALLVTGVSVTNRRGSQTRSGKKTREHRKE